jgi:hypothetical protein
MKDTAPPPIALFRRGAAPDAPRVLLLYMPPFCTVNNAVALTATALLNSALAGAMLVPRDAASG